MSVADQTAAEFATHITETDKSNFHVCASCQVGAAGFAASWLHRREPWALGFSHGDMRLTEFGKQVGFH